jgi:hypothetical protein
MSTQSRLLTRSLLDAARRDGPGEAGKARIWSAVSLAPQLSLVTATTEAARESLRPPVVAPAASNGAAVAGATSIGKILLAGALAGSVLTAGIVAVVWDTSHSTSSQATFERARPLAQPERVLAAPRMSSGVNAAVSPADNAQPLETELDSPETAVAPPSRAVATAQPLAAGNAARAGAHARTNNDDPLMREAALVSAARTSLMQGAATSALSLLDTAKASGAHSLEPEELSLRVRALRMLGRDGEATVVEETLRARYPDSFLAH